MFSSLVRFFRERFGKQQRNPSSTDAEPHEETELESGDTLLPADTGNGGGVVPFDETLLERCRIMWQSGDWEGVKALDRETLQHHPDKAKLALLAAAAHQQTGSIEESRSWLQLAREWGCSKQLMSQIMISGVFNTLARASFAAGQTERARLHFEESMRSGGAKGNLAELTQARIASQTPQLELTESQSGTGRVK